MLPDTHPAYRQPDESLTAWCERVLALVEELEERLKKAQSTLDVLAPKPCP